MARISRFPLDKEVLAKLFQLFFEVVGKKQNKEDFLITIGDILSPVEKIMIAKRVAILYLLLKKIDYENICDRLKVSKATVAKFKLLLEKSGGIKLTFNRLLRNEKILQFLEELFADLYGPGTPGVDWSASWRTKQEIERKKQQGI